MKLVIRKIKELPEKETVQLMLDSEPWKTLGFSARDIKRIARGAKTKLVFGAFYKKQLVGFAIYVPGWLGGAYLNILVVDSAQRGLGVGSALMHHSISHLKKKYKNIYLCVSHFNPKAKKFYESLGFRKIGKIENFFLKDHHEILMRLTFGPIREQK